MNARTYKFYKGIFDLARTDYCTDAEAVTAFMKNSLDFDYDIAAELWDFLAMDAAENANARAEAAAVIGGTILSIMMKKNISKTYRCIVEKESIAYILYGYPDRPCDLARDILIYFVMGTKFEDADAVFAAFQKNRHYGAAMREFLENLFESIKKKTGNVKVTMPKKTAEFLRGHIQKIRGSERALLDQRIKEIL